MNDNKSKGEFQAGDSGDARMEDTAMLLTKGESDSDNQYDDDNDRINNDGKEEQSTSSSSLSFANMPALVLMKDKNNNESCFETNSSVSSFSTSLGGGKRCNSNDSQNATTDASIDENDSSCSDNDNEEGGGDTISEVIDFLREKRHLLERFSNVLSQERSYDATSLPNLWFEAKKIQMSLKKEEVNKKKKKSPTGSSSMLGTAVTRKRQHGGGCSASSPEDPETDKYVLNYSRYVQRISSDRYDQRRKKKQKQNAKKRQELRVRWESNLPALGEWVVDCCRS